MYAYSKANKCTEECDDKHVYTTAKYNTVISNVNQLPFKLHHVTLCTLCCL